MFPKMSVCFWYGRSVRSKKTWRKYTPLYKKDIKQNQNKPTETTEISVDLNLEGLMSMAPILTNKRFLEIQEQAIYQQIFVVKTRHKNTNFT